MLDSILTSAGWNVSSVLICALASLGLGAVIAAVYAFRSSYSRNFLAMLVLLPAIVQAVIMCVNGNLGVGVAVMGAFSLVRFRSVPGSAREIGTIFFAMAVGLATGMGYIGYACIFTAVIGAASMLLTLIRPSNSRPAERSLKITIPETLDYNGIFDDLFATYTLDAALETVKLTNLGSL
ncbi:MAG: DUF4956 domain-containing protein, partial [Clostridia bacterium]|nr:DUF4956 domain-containing protein [Clostridia bacterium]